MEHKIKIMLAASVFHYGLIQIGEVKDYLQHKGVEVRY